MKELEIFYLRGCPYCAMAQKAAAALRDEEPAFSAVPVRWVEEREEPELAETRDYYYVPSVFCGGEKLYEASPADSYETILSGLRTAFRRAMN